MDIQQDAFIRIYQSLMDRTAAVQSLEKWIHRITVNVAIDYFRKERKLNENAVDDNMHPSVEPEIVDQLNLEQLISLLQGVQNPYRLVFNLFIIEGFNHKEISAQLGITEGTSRSYLVRAKEQLKKKLAGTELKHKVYG